MRILFFVSTFLLLNCINIQSQGDCFVGGIHYFNSQAEIDSFGMNCTSQYYLDRVIIEGVDITSLEGFNSVSDCVSLTIRNTSLVSLNGLEGLNYVTNVGGNYWASITIENNEHLKTLDGLQNVRLTSHIQIDSNPVLENIDSLKIITFASHDNTNWLPVSPHIEISNNESLTSLGGILDNLEESEEIRITNNSILTDISTVANINTIDSLIIDNNPALSDLSPITNAKIIRFELINSSLTNLATLNNATIIQFDISGNQDLVSLEINKISQGFTSWIGYLPVLKLRSNPILEDIKIDSLIIPHRSLSLEISDNPLLEFCNQYYVCDAITALSEPGGAWYFVTIENNALGCSTQEGVESICRENEDLLLSMDQEYLDCSRVAFNITIDNVTLQNSAELTLKFSLDTLLGLSTYDFYELDGGTLQNDTLSWLIGDIPPEETTEFQVIAYFARSFNENISEVTAKTSISYPDDIDLTNNTSTLMVGDKPQIDDLILDSQIKVDNSFCYEELDNLLIGGIEEITSLDSLKYLKHVFERLELNTCRNLQVIDGFENLESAKDLIINLNLDLDSIYGFNALKDVDRLIIDMNWDLLHLSGFTSLYSVDSLIQLTGTDSLLSIVNFDPSLTTNPSRVRIDNNFSLQSCNSDFLCNLPDSVELALFNNDPGCENLEELELSCNPMINLELESEYLDCSTIRFEIEIINESNSSFNNSTQLKFYINEAVGNETYNFSSIDGASQLGDTLIWNINQIPPSTTIKHNVFIEIENSFYKQAADLISSVSIDNSDLDFSNNIEELIIGPFQPSSLAITSQSEMDQCYCLIEIPETLDIKDNSSMDPITNLDSLVNLEKVGSMDIGICPLLEEIVGSSNLIEIDKLQIYNNALLQSISGFENLQYLERVNIAFNPMLSDIENFNSPLTSYPSSFILRNNNMLSVCNTPMICAILENDNSIFQIMDNEDGCNSIETIQDSCGISSIHSIEPFNYLIHIYPNPAKNKIFLSYSGVNSTLLEIKLTRLDGSPMHNEQNVDPENWSLNVSNFPQGIYFLTIQIEEGSISKKLILGN